MINHLLNRTCSIQRKAITGLSGGQKTGSFVEVVADVPCRLNVKNRTHIIDDKQVVIAEFKIFFQAGTDIQARDRIVMDDGLTYSAPVGASRFDASSRQHHLEVLLEKVS